MSGRLTIGLPTFNRGRVLEAQLAWLSQARRGFESQCEVLISDNHSNDETPEIIARWVADHGDSGVRVNRNPMNVGAVRNIVYCIEAAKMPHVWVIGDDDIIDDGALRKVIDALEAEPELALLVLNFSSRNARTGRILFERCFNGFDEDIVAPNGKATFERFLGTNQWGGLALTTALIYQTELARKALHQWPTGLDNLTVQLFVTAFCAKSGRTAITSGTYLECTAGSHHFLEDNRTLFSFHSAQMAEAFANLTRLGYSPALCKRKIIDRAPEIRRKLPKLLRQYPFFTTKVLAQYLWALLRVQLSLIASDAADKRSARSRVKTASSQERKR